MLVDDDDEFRRVMSGELARRGYAVNSVASGTAALAQAADADVIILDLRLPDMDGIEVLKKLRSADVPAGVLVLTGHGTIDTAIQAVRLGAYDYLEKPCPLDRMEMAIRKADEHLRLVERQRVLEDGYRAPDVGLDFIGQSPALEKVRQAVARIAPIDSTTLILGETGVGKEMVASSLYAQSRRRERPFVVVDCAALHEQLLQSELFGHEKGAFTGAARLKHGLFEVGNTRDDLPRRGRRNEPRGAGEAPAGARNRPLPAPRWHEGDRGGRPRDLRHQPRPPRRHRSRALPRGFVFPPGAAHHRGPAAARAP